MVVVVAVFKVVVVVEVVVVVVVEVVVVVVEVVVGLDCGTALDVVIVVALSYDRDGYRKPACLRYQLCFGSNLK